MPATPDPKADPMADIKAGFFQECDELLESLADGLEALRTGTGDADSVNAVFRAVHSIKGGAAAFALSDLTDFAHGFEARLMAFRDAGTPPTPADVPALERAADRLAALVALAARGDEVSEEDRLSDASLLSDTEAEAAPVALSIPPGAEGAREMLKALGALGNVSVTCDTGAMADLATYDPDRLTLGWQVSLSTELGGPMLDAALSDLDPSGTIQRSAPSQEAATPNATAKAAPSLQTPTIRVGLDRVDKLINLVGELVINQAMLSRSAETMGAEPNSDHMIGLEELMRLTRDLQDSVMQIRAQPVKPLFQRMARICREAADLGGKNVELVTEGQDTEIDKTVIERLSDPLTHMIRNAVDHAIESPAARCEKGKPEVGRITLSASHRSGQVILEVRDDGRGIDRDKVLARARKKGLIAPDADLTPAEIDLLLFKPGFSTADQVSELSGRGVGMDVVRAAIHNLGGRISIESRPGEGTTFEIALPLTLAVLDAMTVGVADQTLVLPLSTIHETITIRDQDVLELGPGQRMLRYNGRAITLFDLGEELGYHGRRSDLDDRVALITAGDAAATTALAIDEIFEQRQVVIKGLQDGFATASCVAAATILGDGRIALIIDPYDPSLSPGSAGLQQKSAVPLDLGG
ncbi:MAG: chemotaxis protein CheA [Pseudomonadota bacterium]